MAESYMKIGIDNLLWPVNMAQHGKTTKIEAAHDVGIQSLSDCRFKDNAVWGKSQHGLSNYVGCTKQYIAHCEMNIDQS